MNWEMKKRKGTASGTGIEGEPSVAPQKHFFIRKPFFLKTTYTIALCDIRAMIRQCSTKDGKRPSNK